MDAAKPRPGGETGHGTTAVLVGLDPDGPVVLVEWEVSQETGDSGYAFGRRSRPPAAGSMRAAGYA